MKNELLLAGEAYLKAWHTKDLEGIAKHLHPEVHFIGPIAETTGKERVLQSAERMFGILTALSVRWKFAFADHAIFTYDFVWADPVGVCRTAELMTFKDGLISRIELFFDARPFEMLMRSQQPAPQSAQHG